MPLAKWGLYGDTSPFGNRPNVAGSPGNLKFCRKERQHGSRASSPAATGIRGTSKPETTVRSARGGGRRSASAAARSTTRPTRPSGTKSSHRSPRPRDFDLPGPIRPRRGPAARRRPISPGEHGRRRSRVAGSSPARRPERAGRRGGTCPRLTGRGSGPRGRGENRRGMDAGANGAHGRTVMSRAADHEARAGGCAHRPRRRAAPDDSPPRCPAMRPRLICLEIDNPNPEFCPKPWCGRSYRSARRSSPARRGRMPGRRRRSGSRSRI